MFCVRRCTYMQIEYGKWTNTSATVYPTIKYSSLASIMSVVLLNKQLSDECVDPAYEHYVLYKLGVPTPVPIHVTSVSVVNLIIALIYTYIPNSLKHTYIPNS